MIWIPIIILASIGLALYLHYKPSLDLVPYETGGYHLICWCNKKGNENKREFFKII